MSIRIWSKLVDVWQNAIHSIGGMGLSPVEDLATSQEGLVPHSTHTDLYLLLPWTIILILFWLINDLHL